MASQSGLSCGEWATAQDLQVINFIDPCVLKSNNYIDPVSALLCYYLVWYSTSGPHNTQVPLWTCVSLAFVQINVSTHFGGGIFQQHSLIISWVYVPTAFKHHETWFLDCSNCINAWHHFDIIRGNLRVHKHLHMFMLMLLHRHSKEQQNRWFNGHKLLIIYINNLAVNRSVNTCYVGRQVEISVGTDVVTRFIIFIITWTPWDFRNEVHTINVP